MTRSQAEQRASELNQALDDATDGRWIVHRASAGEWELARVSAGALRLPAGEAAARAELGRPQTAPIDPRPTITRLIPPVGPPGL